MSAPARLEAAQPRIQYGSIPSSSFSSGAYELTFPEAFSAAPCVFVTPNAGATDSVTTIGVSGVTATKCNLQIVRSGKSGAITNPNLTVRWMAIGE